MEVYQYILINLDSSELLVNRMLFILKDLTVESSDKSVFTLSLFLILGRMDFMVNL